MKTVKSLSWLIALFGVWELVAPFVLGYTAVGVAMWGAIIIGLALIIVGAWAALSNDEGTIKTLEWVNVILGAWLVIAPFVLSYTSTLTAMWNDIIIGAVVVVLGAWAAVSMGHGSSAGTHTGQTS